MLIGTDFLRTSQTEISHLHGHFSILGYTVPLLFKDSSDAFLVSKEETGRRHVCLQYPHGVLGLPYRVANASVKPLSVYGDNKKVSICGQISLSGFPQRLKLLWTQACTLTSHLAYTLRSVASMVSRARNL
ncbi:hypothetical protein DSO57_1023082 [Entomophthora muscae]|uniref:Uncharacterized protein n=1 Tax=Entomophthora muscae TaxID=34485 RepID=A0ACC2TQI8_9FUNG|nr:hypothetical protein DSO57_1023082 [Entomophthora muscae]